MPEVYQTPFIETGRDLLVGRLESLRATLTAGAYSPSITDVLDGHVHADISPWDVSVSLEQATGEDGEFEKYLGSGIGVKYRMLYSIRVHACYADEWIDTVAVERLLNSIVNKVAQKVNIQLSGSQPDYSVRGISEIETNLTFDESDTRGGQVKVLIAKNVEHMQE